MSRVETKLAVGGESDLLALLTTPFAIAHLLDGVDADRGPLSAGLEGDARRAALDQLAQLRSVHADLLRIRNRLTKKKLSQVKRRELLSARSEGRRRMEDLLCALPLDDRWVAGMVVTIREACEEVERSRATADALSKRFGIAPTELRRTLREARNDENAAHRIAGHLNVTVEEVEQLEREIRLQGRVVRQRVNAMQMEADRMLQLLPLARKWEASRADRARSRIRLSRGGAGRSSVALDLTALAARVDELAAQMVISTDVPNSTRAKTGSVRARRVALLPRAPTSIAPSQSGATYSDLGRAGEALVFAMMRRRWEGASLRDPPRTAALFRHIAAEYWTATPEQSASLDAVLSARPDAWLSSGVVRDLLWPAQTAFGDAMGFDIFGVEEDGGEWICVEVKTTLGPAATQFEITANELDRARREGSRFVIARVANLNGAEPTIHFWRDPASLVQQGTLRLTPTAFAASF